MVRAVLLLIALCEATLSAQWPVDLSLKKTTWTTISTFSRFPLGNLPDGSLFFDFPSTGSIKYLYDRRPPSSLLGATHLLVALTVETTGTPVFRYDTEPSNTCVTPAKVRPFLWANHNGGGEFDRWWSNPVTYTLAAGSAVLDVPLSPESWSSVFGKFGTYDAASLEGFLSALSHVSSLGVTFGGGCFFGHGVYVTDGIARFILTSYQVR